jgi:prolyl 4-hydroxylase
MAPEAIIIRGALTPDECRDFLAVADSAKYYRNGEAGPNGALAMFTGDRVRATVTSQKMADLLWSRIGPHIVPRDYRGGGSFNGPNMNGVKWGRYKPVGVADLLRFSRYDQGGSFHTHYDTVYARDDQYVGMHTILVYLNDDYEGGETVVYDAEERPHVVKPETGMALVFYHHQLHNGQPVRSGHKRILRSEVIFKLGEA